MCGIWAFIEILKSGSTSQPVDHSRLFADFMTMKARGPDMTSFTTMKNISVGFHRLAIMDPTFHANQPYIIEDGERTIIFVCNGEIYDFKDLIKEHNLPIHNNSDCMTIPLLYLKTVQQNKSGRNNIDKFADLFRTQIKGEYAFIIFEFDRLQNLKEVVVMLLVLDHYTLVLMKSQLYLVPKLREWHHLKEMLMSFHLVHYDNLYLIVSLELVHNLLEHSRKSMRLFRETMMMNLKIIILLKQCI